MNTITLVEFHNWITRKYVEWRGSAIGHERSISEFAEYIGVSQQLMSGWMKPGGMVPRSQKSINKLVAVYGAAEVYEALGLDAPKSQDEELRQIPPELREQFIQDRKEFIRQWLEDHGFKRLK